MTSSIFSGKRCTKSVAWAPEEAKNQLLQQLSRELANEQGALIMKRERELNEICDAKARNAHHRPAALRRRSHRRSHHQHGRHSQRPK